MLFDSDHTLTHLRVDTGCELSRVGQFSSPPLQLLAADWWTSSPDGSVSLCLTGSPYSWPEVSCAPWSLGQQPDFFPLPAHRFIAPDLALVDAPDWGYSLARLQPDPTPFLASLFDAQLGQIGGRPNYAGGIADGDTVIVAAGEPRMDGLWLGRFRPNQHPDLHELEHRLDGELLGLVPTRVTGAPGFVVLLSDERKVRVHILRVNAGGIWQQ